MHSLDEEVNQGKREGPNVQYSCSKLRRWLLVVHGMCTLVYLDQSKTSNTQHNVEQDNINMHNCKFYLESLQVCYHGVFTRTSAVLFTNQHIQLSSPRCICVQISPSLRPSLPDPNPHPTQSAITTQIQAISPTKPSAKQRPAVCISRP